VRGGDDVAADEVDPVGDVRKGRQNAGDSLCCLIPGRGLALERLWMRRNEARASLNNALLINWLSFRL